MNEPTKLSVEQLRNLRERVDNASTIPTQFTSASSANFWDDARIIARALLAHIDTVEREREQMYEVLSWTDRIHETTVDDLNRANELNLDLRAQLEKRTVSLTSFRDRLVAAVRDGFFRGVDCELTQFISTFPLAAEDGENPSKS